MSALQRKKRLTDGTFGDLTKVFPGETDAEKVARLEAENEQLRESNLAAFIAIAEIFEIMEGGV